MRLALAGIGISRLDFSEKQSSFFMRERPRLLPLRRLERGDTTCFDCEIMIVVLEVSFSVYVGV
jgi:hypothetical protein